MADPEPEFGAHGERKARAYNRGRALTGVKGQSPCVALKLNQGCKNLDFKKVSEVLKFFWYEDPNTKVRSTPYISY